MVTLKHYNITHQAQAHYQQRLKPHSALQCDAKILCHNTVHRQLSINGKLAAALNASVNMNNAIVVLLNMN